MHGDETGLQRLVGPELEGQPQNSFEVTVIWFARVGHAVTRDPHRAFFAAVAIAEEL
jgi:hypothetical protein